MRSEIIGAEEKRAATGADPRARESARPATVDNRFTFIHRLVTDDSVCVLTFDRPNSSANVFDRAALGELDAHLDFITESAHLKGLVLASAKNSIFIAGADLHALAGAAAGDLTSLIELGQTVFNRLASLSIPSVAAIHGACLGGGLEA